MLALGLTLITILFSVLKDCNSCKKTVHTTSDPDGYYLYQLNLQNLKEGDTIIYNDNGRWTRVVIQN